MSLPLLQNFIDGRFVPATTDATSTSWILERQVVAQCPVSGAADVDAAYDAALKAFESWRLTTPADRQLLLLRLADALEANADRLVEAQRRNTGQLAEMIRAEEVLTGASQLRFFAGAARLQAGVASGEYAEGLNSQIRREPIGVVGRSPVELPLHDAHLEGRTRSSRRQHGGAQAECQHTRECRCLR